MSDTSIHDIVETALMVASVLSLTAAAVVTTYGSVKKRLRPRPVWLYVGGIVTFFAVWRIVVFAVYGLTDDTTVSELGVAMRQWLGPMSALTHTLGGFAFLILAWSGLRKRRTDDNG